MATYKLDIEQKFGQLRFRLYPIQETPGEFAGESNDIRALIDKVGAALDKLDESEDSVIFRNIDYTDRGALTETIRRSTF